MPPRREREVAQERDAQAGGDERLCSLEIVRLERDARREAGVAAEPVDALPVCPCRAVGVRHDPCLVGEVRHGDGIPTGQTVTGGQDDAVLVIQQMHELEAAVGGAGTVLKAVDEREVDLAGAQERAR